MNPPKYSPNDSDAPAPKVSVVIPTYNSAAFLERSIRSIQAQTLDDLEILVCDDASTDSTVDMVHEFARDDSRITLLALEVNAGAGAARNLGLSAARGEYIAFLDSDDEWFPEKLARQVALMDEQPEEVGVCFCGAEIIRDGDSEAPTHYYKPNPVWENNIFYRFVMSHIAFITPTVLFRRALLKDAGLMIPEMRRSQDVEFLVRLFKYSGLKVLEECLVRVHMDTSPSKKIYDRLKNAFPYLYAHQDYVREKFGRKVAIRRHAGIRMNLCKVALRERRYGQAFWQFLCRIRIRPLLSRGDLRGICKAFARGIMG
ncbi:MAG: glycosyltransferase family 2 protein [Phycisphaerales bacterium]|nr:glycosyltransferase family 2 protein [Phycisphaerales bacterium]MBT7170260.1 glycosyltransferase family 2 protein [Phycisphaerales bacterium]